MLRGWLVVHFELRQHSTNFRLEAEETSTSRTRKSVKRACALKMQKSARIRRNRAKSAGDA